MKTERLVVLVTPEQKRSITRNAKSLDMSVAELLRRSAEGFGAGADDAALGALARQLQIAVKESRAALRAALAEAEATVAQLRKRGRQRQVA
jgi:cell division protein ZapA (FtsZ GTPase activity inhibitor)